MLESEAGDPVYRNATFAVNHRPACKALWVGVHAKPTEDDVDRLLCVIAPWLQAQTADAPPASLALYFEDLAPMGEVAFDHEAALALVKKLIAHRESIAHKLAGCVIQGRCVDLTGLFALEAFAALYGPNPPLMLVNNARSALEALTTWTDVRA